MSKIGALITLKKDVDVFEQMRRLREAGCECCQVTVWDMSMYTAENAERVRAAADENGIEISTLWAGWSGPVAWNVTAGPSTLGIVPEAYRMKRAEELIRGADFAVKLGVSRMATHAGFLPENINDPRYLDVLAVLKYIVAECAKRNVCFLFETGQETPFTLLRFIEQIDSPFVGINMDTANLMLYGKGNSADAITVFGKYVMDTHIKDGLYPTDGMKLGVQMKVGEGMANIPEVIKRLQAVDYKGNYIVEREISGDQQMKDIADTVEYLKQMLR